MKYKRLVKSIICGVLCTVIAAGIFAGCGKDEKRIDFIYPFSADVRSFDPQVASTSDEFLIIENCYEGLVRVNDDGSIQPGVAESWNISKDGKTYTFKLRQGAKWNIQSLKKDTLTAAQKLMGEDFNPDITAHDFVFALRRAVEKNTNAPLFPSVSNIENAVRIHSGKAKADALGVKALDDYTLQIKLNSPDDGFMDTLSTSVAMPCNEEYFNATKGRYGLGPDYSIFNGQFYLSAILESSYILKNNSQYVGEYPSEVTDITLVISDENTDTEKYLKSGYFDCAYISGKEYEALKDSGITATEYSDKILAFVLNKNSAILSNKKLRQAVCLSISDTDAKGAEYLSAATGYVPPSCIIAGKSATDVLADINTRQDAAKATQLWKSGLEELGASTAEFTVITTAEYEEVVKELVQGIQAVIGSVTSYGEDDRTISFSLKISVLSAEEYNDALARGEYDLAFCKFTTTTHNPLTLLDSLINDSYAGVVSDAREALNKAQSADAKTLVEKTEKCEKALMSDYSIKPVFFEASYYAEAKGVSGVSFHPGSGRVCFVNATRAE